MSTDNEARREVDLLEQLGDELKLHAWLAGAELRRPSLRHEPTRREVDALARLRDELRLQVHLGRLEAQGELARLDGRWRRLKQLATRQVEDAEETVHDVLAEIRDGYRRLRGEHG